MYTYGFNRTPCSIIDTSADRVKISFRHPHEREIVQMWVETDAVDGYTPSKPIVFTGGLINVCVVCGNDSIHCEQRPECLQQSHKDVGLCELCGLPEPCTKCGGTYGQEEAKVKGP